MKLNDILKDELYPFSMDECAWFAYSKSYSIERKDLYYSELDKAYEFSKNVVAKNINKYLNLDPSPRISDKEWIEIWKLRQIKAILSMDVDKKFIDELPNFVIKSKKIIDLCNSIE